MFYVINLRSIRKYIKPTIKILLPLLLMYVLPPSLDSQMTRVMEPTEKIVITDLFKDNKTIRDITSFGIFYMFARVLNKGKKLF